MTKPTHGIGLPAGNRWLTWRCHILAYREAAAVYFAMWGLAMMMLAVKTAWCLLLSQVFVGETLQRRGLLDAEGPMAEVLIKVVEEFDLPLGEATFHVEQVVEN